MGLFRKSSIFYLMLLRLLVSVSCDSETIVVDVGVVLDFGSLLGITSNASIALAVEDFYKTWGKDYRTRLTFHYRDSQGSAIGAASAGLDLIHSAHVQAIIGPQTSEEADFLAPICNNANVPVVSFSVTSSFHSQPGRAPYFLRMAENDVFQVRAIAAIIEAYNWRDVALVHDDSYGGTILVPYLVDALQEVGAHIHHIVISPTTENEVDAPIHQTLVKLSAMGIKVFIVNLPVLLAKSFFRGAVDVGMMVNGYSWILTSQLANLVGSMDTSMIKSMQGVLGVRTYVPESIEIEDFRDRWKWKLQRELLDVEILDLNVYALWAYETVQALAFSIENSLSSIGNGSSHYSLWSHNKGEVKFTGLFDTLISLMGSRLLKSLLDTEFKGLSGDIRLIDGQLNTSSVLEIINVAGKGGRAIGYWTPTNGLSQSSRLTGKNYSSKREDLVGVVWPGGSIVAPSGRMTANGSEKVLKIGVPITKGFKEFVDVEWDPIQQKNVIKGGFAPDVFRAVMDTFPQVSFDFFPYDNGHVDELGYYDELIYQVYLQAFPRGSNMIADISRAVLKLSEGKNMSLMEAKWFGNTSCSDQLDAFETQYELGMYSFCYIYIFTIAASLVTVIIYTIDSLYIQSRLLSVVQAAPEQSLAEDTTQAGTAGEVAQNHQVITIQEASNDTTLGNSRSNNVVLPGNPPAREISLIGIPSYTLTHRNFSI